MHELRKHDQDERDQKRCGEDGPLARRQRGYGIIDGWNEQELSHLCSSGQSVRNGWDYYRRESKPRLVGQYRRFP